MSSLILLIPLLPASQRSFNLWEVIKIKFIITFLSVHFFVGVTLSLAQSTFLKLLGDFEEGWSHHWDGQKIHWLWKFSLMLKKSRPVIYTFGAVFLVIFMVGLVTVPTILNYAQRIYFMLQ